ncbi:MAG: hypothetical protein NTW97_03180 [Candidatus Krumholzibacteria bacterium]|nr:hypothetical protein [Candidatus Krumholzibacteria bacterium]
MVSILKKLNRFARKWFFILTHVGAVTRFVNDPKVAYSYYPDLPAKSKARVWFELIGWLFRHGEVNVFYYSYGFDVGSVDQSAYMPYNEFKALRNRLNDSARIGKHATSYLVLLRDKYMFSLFLSSLGFPTPKVLGFCMGDQIEWLDTHTTEGIDSLMKRPGLKVFCKTILGESAEGAFPLRVEGDTLLLDGAPVTLSDLTQRLRGGFIIQEFIEQHPRTAELYPSCLNTLRINTIRKGNDIVLFAACMKMGANESTRDNWASGGLLGVVDRETGRLTREFKYRPGCGGIAVKHPQSGIVFEGFEIPYFKEAVRMAIELHSFLYGIHSIGWDVAITKNGPLIIEGNDNWVIAAHQGVEGGLKARFLDTLVPAGKGGSC